MEQTKLIQFNLTDFMRARLLGTGKVVKLNGVPHYSKRQFNPDTGEQIAVLIQLGEEDVKADIEARKVALASLEQLLADIQNAPEKLAVAEEAKP